MGAGDNEEFPVELEVGNGDQGLVLASVVPPQHPVGNALCGAQSEDAFHVSGLKILSVDRLHILTSNSVEEGGWRELLVIAYDYHLCTTSDGTQRLNRAHLTSLVHQDEIELERAGFDKPRQGHW